MSVYLRLTREFNEGRLRAVICSGQAVVLHRLAIMSKDGDWILREDGEALGHVLAVLARHGARYRFGAPLDCRWMSGGWSAHFEFVEQGLRVRTDFFTRPPRIDDARLSAIWREQESRDPPFVDAKSLALMKMTNREKDYAVIGELARLLTDPADRLRFSRSARELCDLAAQHPQLASRLSAERPLLQECPHGVAAIERALDAERRRLINENETRLLRYSRAAETWRVLWPDVQSSTARMDLPAAHGHISSVAEGVLPFTVE